MYKIIYEKCENEAKASAANLLKECEEVLDEVEYLKKVENTWSSFQRHYVNKFYFILLFSLVL